MSGRSFCGKPGTRAPTVADVPGSADGLGGAVVEDCAEAAGFDADDDVSGLPEAAGVHAAKANNAPAAAMAAAARLRCPNTFTGTFLLVLKRNQPPV
jgi:hypothetical protein